MIGSDIFILRLSFLPRILDWRFNYRFFGAFSLLCSMNIDMDEKRISLLLTSWYEENKRDLPWRNTRDPYKIWLSEIILQQTRVDQGLSYYLRFCSSFPDIFALAKAGEDEVLKSWQGLGYYSRARHMHHTAVEIVSRYKGVFPRDYDTLLTFKGIGPYTAAAIASFAFDLPYPVIDGNVMRVLARIFNVDQAIDTVSAQNLFKQFAWALLDKNKPALHNQAIMEFGALQCKPAQVDCLHCPLNELCLSKALGLVDQRPVRKATPNRKKRYFNYLCLSDGSNTWLQQRKKKDIWQNLWEFPLIEANELLEWPSLQAILSQELSLPPNVSVLSSHLDLKHVLSHQDIYARFFTAWIPENSCAIPDDWLSISLKEIDKPAVSRLTEIYLEQGINELDFKSSDPVR